MKFVYIQVSAFILLAFASTASFAQESGTSSIDQKYAINCIASALSLGDVDNYVVNELGKDISDRRDWQRHVSAIIELSGAFGIGGSKDVYSAIASSRTGQTKARLSILRSQDAGNAMPIFYRIHESKCSLLYEILENPSVSDEEMRKCVRYRMLFGSANRVLGNESWYPDKFLSTETDISIQDVKAISSRNIYGGGNGISDKMIDEETKSGISFIESSEAVSELRANLETYWNELNGLCQRAFSLE